MIVFRFGYFAIHFPFKEVWHASRLYILKIFDTTCRCMIIGVFNILDRLYERNIWYELSRYVWTLP